MTNIEEAARAEAWERYDGDRVTDEETGEEGYDDWGFSANDREVFVTGALWLAEYLLSDESVRRATEALHHCDGLLPTDLIPYHYRREALAALSAALGKEQS